MKQFNLTVNFINYSVFEFEHALLFLVLLNFNLKNEMLHDDLNSNFIQYLKNLLEETTVE
jgi:hypothetical protein